MKESNKQQQQQEDQSRSPDGIGIHDNTRENNDNIMSLTRTELEATVRAIVNELVSNEKQGALPEKGMGGYYYTSMDLQETGEVLL